MPDHVIKLFESSKLSFFIFYSFFEEQIFIFYFLQKISFKEIIKLY